MTGTYEWRGQKFRGMRNVADTAGVHLKTVWDHLDRYGHLEMLGVNKSRRLGNRVVVGDRQWSSQKAMARDLCVSEQTVAAYLRRGDIAMLVSDRGEPASDHMCPNGGA